MQISRISYVLLGLLTVAATEAAAQDAYRWVEKDGRVVYGSKPPANAKSAQGIKTQPLSRYSSDKVLKRLGWEKKAAEPSPGSKPATSGSSGAKTVDRPVHVAPAKLEAAEPSAVQGPDGSIVSCSVIVKNVGESSAEEVSIAFEFADGTLLPGVGPDSLEVGKDYEFKIPDDVLPIRLKPGTDITPKVIVHGAT